MVRPERIELPTSWFVAMHSIQLSYGRIVEELCLWIITEAGWFRPHRITAKNSREKRGPSSIPLPICAKSRARTACASVLILHVGNVLAIGTRHVPPLGNRKWSATGRLGNCLGQRLFRTPLCYHGQKLRRAPVAQARQYRL